MVVVDAASTRGSTVAATLVDVPTIAQLPDLFGSKAYTLLYVATPGVDPPFDEAAQRLLGLFDDVLVARVRPELIDTDALWFRMFAAPKLRRLGLRTDQVVRGYYVFHYDGLLGWHPPTRYASVCLDRWLGHRP